MPKEYKTFSTGARREKKTGKGRYDLISPIAIQMLADVLEEGSEKVDDRNWEKGLPLSSYIDSALRHIFQHLEGRRDEPHLRNAMWNLMAAIHTDEMIARGRLPKDLDDLPCYTPTEVPEDIARPDLTGVSFTVSPECEASINRSFIMGAPELSKDQHPSLTGQPEEEPIQTFNKGDRVETLLGLTGVVVQRHKDTPCYKVKLDLTGTVEVLHSAEMFLLG